MTEVCGKTLAMLDDERTPCCVGTNEETVDYSLPCIGANEESLDRSSPGKLAWYFAQRSMPGLVYAATMNGYVASDPYITKGGNENV